MFDERALWLAEVRPRADGCVECVAGDDGAELIAAGYRVGQGRDTDYGVANDGVVRGRRVDGNTSASDAVDGIAVHAAIAGATDQLDAAGGVFPIDGVLRDRVLFVAD